MIETCSHVYPDGRPCRRIPKRTETLCPSHRRRSAKNPDDLFARQMRSWADHLQALPLHQLFAVTVESLNAVGPIMESRSSRGHRLIFTRAAVAAAIAAELLEAGFSHHPQTAAPLSAAELDAKEASLAQLSALCERFEKALGSDTCEQTL